MMLSLLGLLFLSTTMAEVACTCIYTSQGEPIAAQSFGPMASCGPCFDDPTPLCDEASDGGTEALFCTPTNSSVSWNNLPKNWSVANKTVSNCPFVFCTEPGFQQGMCDPHTYCCPNPNSLISLSFDGNSGFKLKAEWIGMNCTSAQTAGDVLFLNATSIAASGIYAFVNGVPPPYMEADPAYYMLHNVSASGRHSILIGPDFGVTSISSASYLLVSDY